MFSTAKSQPLKGSIYKANLVAGLVRKMKASEALLQLKFSKKGLSKSLAKVISSAVANAENNYSMDIDLLYVSEILVGKAYVLKRYEARARGRAGKIRKEFFRYTVKLSEM